MGQVGQCVLRHVCWDVILFYQFAISLFIRTLYQTQLTNTTEGSTLLNDFCELQSALNVAESQPGHYDHAILITG